jgi:hypothetical protein
MAFLAALAAGCQDSKPEFGVQLIPLKDPFKPNARNPEPPVALAAHPIVFSVTIPAHLQNAKLETRVVRGEDKLVWVGVGLRRTEQGTGLLYLPARFLSPGEYRLVVGRAMPGADRAEFPFRLE